jgi:hypothetical protein
MQTARFCALQIAPYSAVCRAVCRAVQSCSNVEYADASPPPHPHPASPPHRAVLRGRAATRTSEDVTTQPLVDLRMQCARATMLSAHAACLVLCGAARCSAAQRGGGRAVQRGEARCSEAQRGAARGAVQRGEARCSDVRRISVPRLRLAVHRCTAPARGNEGQRGATRGRKAVQHGEVRCNAVDA